MIKTKLFDVPKKGEPEGNAEINEWLEQNPEVAILSTNSFSNDTGWGYIILYDDYKPVDYKLTLKEGESIA
jgi:hypothetical protein